MDHPAIRRIEPRRSWVALNLRELWDHRELVMLLTRRDLTVRYRQTIAGAFWAVIQPFLAMVIFSVVFGRIIGAHSDGIPYPLFSFAGLVPWMFFANNIMNASASIVGHAPIITRTYFPRLALPLAPILSGLVDLLLASVVLAGLMVYYQEMPSIRVFALPAFVLLATIASLGVGLLLGTLNVIYRDVGHAVPFLTQFWLFATPIIYPASMMSERSRIFAGLNPMTGVAEGFRWALFDGAQPPGSLLLVSTAVSLLMLLVGAYYFRRMEETFADVV